MQQESSVSPIALLATSEPWHLVGLSRAAWFKMRQEKQTPPPIFLLRGRPSWRVKDIIAWLDGLPAEERHSSRGGLRPGKAEGAADAV
jgi:predicted DNA-binding transcriptional regulator AlpA